MIRAYCEAQGIEVPIGFGRHPANRYVAVDATATPPKLVARTWLTQEDAVYSLTHLAPGVLHRVFDFKERQELVLTGHSLERRSAF